MEEVRLALIGYGNVAQGLTQILLDEGDKFARERGLRFLITAIADPLKGSAFNEDGLDLAGLLASVREHGVLRDIPGSSSPNWDALEMIQNSPADVVIELSYTNLLTGEPSTTYITEALRRKKHVITTNKGPIALHYDALEAIARLHGVSIGLEGTVMSGTPAMSLGTDLLAGAGIQRIQGILNGTTNYILTQMESGKSYAEALAEAQAQGYAEADPTGDVEGFDAAAKVAILSCLVLGKTIAFADIEREGITRLSVEDIELAKAQHRHWKLVGSLTLEDGQVKASVRPECLADDHPLARVGGVTNAIVFTTRLMGDVTLIGPGAGRLQTGYAIIQDLFSIYS
jgi:homoserine dehydrogenase